MWGSTDSKLIGLAIKVTFRWFFCIIRLNNLPSLTWFALRKTLIDSQAAQGPSSLTCPNLHQESFCVIFIKKISN